MDIRTLLFEWGGARTLAASILSTTSIFLHGQMAIPTDGQSFFARIHQIELYGGPRISFNHGDHFVSNYKGLYQNEKHLKWGSTVGISAIYAIKRNFGIRFGLSYDTNGLKTTLSTPIYDISRQFLESTYTYKYLSFGLSPTVYLNRKHQLTLSLGPYLSALQQIKGREKATFDPPDDVDLFEFNGKAFRWLHPYGGVQSWTVLPGISGMKKFDFGISSRIGYQMEFSKKCLVGISLLYNVGLYNINRTNFGHQYIEYSQNISLMCSLAFKK